MGAAWVSYLPMRSLCPDSWEYLAHESLPSTMIADGPQPVITNSDEVGAGIRDPGPGNIALDASRGRRTSGAPSHTGLESNPDYGVGGVGPAPGSMFDWL
jgi:hypothetical protein